MSHCLHTCNLSPFNSTRLEQVLALTQPKQALVLIEDGVYGALASSPAANALKTQIEQGLTCFAVKADLQARGLSDLIPGINTISMEEFVTLTAQHNPIQSWY